MIFLKMYLALFLFFTGYVITVQLLALHARGKLPWPGYVFGLPWVVIGVALDVVFQYTVFAALYREWPPKKEYFVTKRLRRWKATDPTSQRGVWSAKLCKFLNLFDPSGEHC
jgi:hypothetical protein